MSSSVKNALCWVYLQPQCFFLPCWPTGIICRWYVVLSMLQRTPAESKCFIFSVNRGGGEQREGDLRSGVCYRCSRHKDDDDGSVGVQVLGAREVTLAMVETTERSQPSVMDREELTQHHCLVWRGTLGSLEGPDLLGWDQNGVSGLHENQW